MNVALSELPDFTCLRGFHAQPHHSSGIIGAPALRYMDRAYRAHGRSTAPVVEMLIPSTVDDSLAPPGAHVASLFCQHFSPDLGPGTSWDEHREQVADLVIDTVNRYAPNFKASVLDRMVNRSWGWWGATSSTAHSASISSSVPGRCSATPITAAR